jgi:hypothetical protein
LLIGSAVAAFQLWEHPLGPEVRRTFEGRSPAGGFRLLLLIAAAWLIWVGISALVARTYWRAGDNFVETYFAWGPFRFVRRYVGAALELTNPRGAWSLVVVRGGSRTCLVYAAPLVPAMTLAQLLARTAHWPLNIANRITARNVMDARIDPLTHETTVGSVPPWALASGAVGRITGAEPTFAGERFAVTHVCLGRVGPYAGQKIQWMLGVLLFVEGEENARYCLHIVPVDRGPDAWRQAVGLARAWAALFQVPIVDDAGVPHSVPALCHQILPVS